MKLEEVIFRSRLWNSIKGRIPLSLRSFLAGSLLGIKRTRSLIRCFLSMSKYLTNWPSSIIRELMFRKDKLIPYSLRNSLNLTIRAKSYDKFIVQEIYIGAYDIALRDLPPNPTIIDAGAHIGVFATKVMKEIPGAHLFCIEPIVDNLELLRENLNNNNFSTRVTIAEGLLSNSEDSKIIYGRKNHSAGFNLYMPTEVQYTAASYTLESFFRDQNITSCDLLKLDIEGGEYEVLESTPEHVFKRIKSIVMEYHPFPKESADIKELSNFISKQGYTLNLYSKKMLYASKLASRSKRL